MSDIENNQTDNQLPPLPPDADNMPDEEIDKVVASNLRALNKGSQKKSTEASEETPKQKVEEDAEEKEPAEAMEAAEEGESEESAKGETKGEADSKKEAKDEKPRVSRELLQISRMRKQAQKEIERWKEEARREIEEERKKLAAASEKKDKDGGVSWETFLSDPVGTLKKAGIAPIDMAKILASAELGKEPSADVRLLGRQMQTEQGLRSELAALRKELEELRQREREREEKTRLEQFARQLQQSYGDFVKNLLQKEDSRFTFLRREAEKAPERAQERLFRMAVLYANEYPDDPVPSPEQVAEWVEESLAEELQPFLDIEDQKKHEKPESRKRSESSGKQSLSTDDLAGRSQKEELPEDDEELNQVIAARLRAMRQKR